MLRSISPKRAARRAEEVAAAREARRGANVAALLATNGRPASMSVPAAAAPVPKDVIVRDERHLRAVASLPCRACGIEGYSQAAHVPPDGKGIKQSDLETFPLCCTRPGVTGCHVEFDQYRMFPDSQETRRVGRQWAAETRALLGRLNATPVGER